MARRLRRDSDGGILTILASSPPPSLPPLARSLSHRRHYLGSHGCDSALHGPQDGLRPHPRPGPTPIAPGSAAPPPPISACIPRASRKAGTKKTGQKGNRKSGRQEGRKAGQQASSWISTCRAARRTPHDAAVARAHIPQTRTRARIGQEKQALTGDEKADGLLPVLFDRGRFLTASAHVLTMRAHFPTRPTPRVHTLVFTLKVFDSTILSIF
jgi:hypothetical protein